MYSGFFCEIFLSVNLYRLCKLGIFWLKITFKSFPLKPLNQIKPNLAVMVPGLVPFKIMSDSPTLHSRWLLLLKIEISSIRDFRVKKSFVKEVKKDYFISRRLTFFQHGCRGRCLRRSIWVFQLSIDALMPKNIKKIIPTVIYVFFLIWQIIIGLSVYYDIICCCNSNIDTGKIPS